MKWLSAAIFTCVTLVSVDASSEPIKPMPPDLRKAADCMYDILKKEPGFEKAKLGLVNSEGFWVPYLQYLSPADGRGRRITVSFEAEVPCTALHRSFNCCMDKGRYCFVAILGGLFAPPDTGPPDGDTQVVIKKWNAQCNVAADAEFV